MRCRTSLTQWGDVDAFIEQFDEQARKVPKVAAEIARRLLAAGRAGEAWQTIEATEHRRRTNDWDWPDFEWQDTRIDVLDARAPPATPKPLAGSASSARYRRAISGPT
jgi:hypothetical protein